MRSIRRIEPLASKRPINISQDIDGLRLIEAHSENDGYAETNGWSHDLAMARILISAAFCTNSVSNDREKPRTYVTYESTPREWECSPCRIRVYASGYGFVDFRAGFGR